MCSSDLEDWLKAENCCVCNGGVQTLGPSTEWTEADMKIFGSPTPAFFFAENVAGTTPFFQMGMENSMTPQPIWICAGGMGTPCSWSVGKENNDDPALSGWCDIPEWQ